MTEPRRDRGVTLYGSGGRIYQVIDAAEGVRGRLDGLRSGDVVEAVLEPVRCRGDGWRIARICEAPSSASPPRRSEPDADDGSVTRSRPR
ncbi:hypothetical protein [Halorubrum sp. AS12]|uniref:hypothetical protein n=1 Tax=Halorubrum sp. AS12 TaxID=3409687 RepID=UPI003DA76C91